MLKDVRITEGRRRPLAWLLNCLQAGFQGGDLKRLRPKLLFGLLEPLLSLLKFGGKPA